MAQKKIKGGDRKKGTRRNSDNGVTSQWWTENRGWKRRFRAIMKRRDGPSVCKRGTARSTGVPTWGHHDPLSQCKKVIVGTLGGEIVRRS